MIERIGKYLIQVEIGRGGFGQVYRAFDPTVGRHVAIKILSSDADRDLLTRFRNEASAAGKLRHNNIVTIYDFGDNQGLPYIVMELLDGIDLQRAIQTKAPLPLVQKVRVMAQVAHGLQAAHRAGIVHRDVKPGNIMLLNDGSVKIMDFGIARLTQESGTRLTQRGSLIGTVRYMSPEQFRGMDTDALCDIWAYGVIYYELLTGQHPFGAGEAAALMYNVTHEPHVPLRSLAPDTPEEIERLVDRALDKDRDRRYQSLEDLYFDVEPVLARLQRERAAQLADQARALVRNDQAEEASHIIREILELDPGNETARKLREATHPKLQRKPMPPVVEALVKTGEQELAARRYHEALENFESAFKLDHSNSQIRLLVDQAKLMLDRSRKGHEFLAAARQELERRNLSAAYRNVSEAIENDPNNTTAKMLLDAIWKEIEQTEGGPGQSPSVTAAMRPATPAASRPGAETPAPPVATALPPRPAVRRRPLIATALIAAVVFVIAAVSVRVFRGSRGVEIRSTPAGVTVRVGDRACVTPDCVLDLPPGAYQLEARLEGYQPLAQPLTIDRSTPPVELKLEPLPASVQISTNFASGSVALDGRPAGELRDGQLAVNQVAAGRHELTIRSREGQTTIRFENLPGKPPALSGPIDAREVQAVVVANLGSQARLDSNSAGGRVTLDGRDAGQAGPGGLALQGFSEGTHEVRLGDRRVIVGGRTTPTLNVFLASDRNVGTLVVETGEDGVAVFLNNRRYERTTSQGLLNIPLDVRQYSVRVEKPGYQSPPAQLVELHKGGLERVVFKLTPQSPILAIRGAAPGTQVLLDGRLVGATDADGNFSAAAPAGEHTVDLVRDRHTPRRKTVRFEPGRTAQIGPGEVELAAIVERPQPAPPVQQQPPPQAPAPAPPPKPDPRAIEAADWEHVRNSRDIAAIEEFRRKHPGSPLAEQAARRIEQIEWESVNKKDAAALRSFIQKYPGSALAQQALSEAARLDQADRTQTDQQGIRQALARYAAAYEGRDADALTAIWPSIPARTLAAIRQSFRNARSIAMELKPNDADVSGDAARVVCQRTLRQNFGDKPLQNQDSITIRLQRKGGTWFIDSVQ